MMKKNKNKKIIISTFLLFVFTLSAEISTRSLKVSEYMMAPVSTWADVPESSLVTKETTASGELGFRVVHLKRSTQASKQAAVDLAATGIVQSGDIFLSFRPEWDGTLAYAHMQLGVSHAALAFVVEQGGSKFIHTLETPINYSSPMNSSHHYGDLNAIHVIRPNLNNEQRANLSGWAKKILANPGRFGFFTDYATPWYKRGANRTPLDQIKELAKVATSGGSFSAYCSEFVWTFLGLRDCNPASYAPGCEKVIFGTQNGALTGLVPGLAGNAGLIQGPEAALVSGGKNETEKKQLLTQSAFVDILTSPDQLAGRMSSGHRAVAEANSDLMKFINQGYYAGGEPAEVAAKINSGVTDNFSPTSFMIRSNAKLDGFKYVGTVVFDR
ncbi:MAG: hypothetical protein R3A80_13305 [Bdellovibrionota bacterium]